MVSTDVLQKSLMIWDKDGSREKRFLTPFLCTPRETAGLSPMMTRGRPRSSPDSK